jgi:hypothetical protein
MKVLQERSKLVGKAGTTISRCAGEHSVLNKETEHFVSYGKI